MAVFTSEPRVRLSRPELRSTTLERSPAIPHPAGLSNLSFPCGSIVSPTLLKLSGSSRVGAGRRSRHLLLAISQHFNNSLNAGPLIIRNGRPPIPHPEGRRCGRLEGWPRVRALCPSFETHASQAPRDEVLQTLMGSTAMPCVSNHRTRGHPSRRA